MTRALWTTAALLLLGATPAGAATVGYADAAGCDETASKYMQCELDLVVTALPGEANRVTVSTAEAVVTLQDAGAPLSSTDPRCAAEADGSLRCAAPQSQSSGSPGRVDVRAGDGDDTVVFGPGGGIAEGGAGDDVLTGSDQVDILAGGPGRDVLNGNGGFDTLDPGADDGAADQLDGGDGPDTLTYAGQRAPVEVDLGRASARTGVVTDRVVGFELLEGSRGHDHLTGSPGPDDITGGPGDVVDGGAGDDELTRRGDGGGGTMRGGPGDDVLQSFSQGRGQRVSCGAGADRVLQPMPTDVLDGSCELVRGFSGAAVRLRPRAGVVRARSLARRGAATLTAGGRLLARRSPVTRAFLPLRATAVGRRSPTPAVATVTVMSAQRAFPLLRFRLRP